MCSLLGQQWTRVDPEQLPSEAFGPVDYDVRDKYVYELMRQDLSH